ncbi:rac GTPase-activating protein 1-like isoform X1 [Amphibalanus amphitrite]|uniref:rac GTPase-activating protein 1-like isoform X1 n=1 Tax=Amphibalanus amphitrite TaxID=1232801 RepID=UPI001C91C23E|nr:rac GTPase-activating protein 1-like isoform X1 [Amphibalanus amphitrite]
MTGFGLSLVATFDDLCRHTKVMTEGTESKFLEFVNTIEAFRLRWVNSEAECQRLHAQLVQANTEITRLENNVKQAKNLLDNEKKRRFLVEQDREAYERQLNLIRELMFNEPHAVNNETREKMLQLSQSVAAARPRERRSSNRLGTISESVGSLLSADDLSLDYTEEDLDVSHLRSGRVIQRSRGQKRTSDVDTEEDDGTGATRARRRTRKAKRRNRQASPSPAPAAAAPDTGSSSDQAATMAARGEALVATTTVTVPLSGAVTATSQLRARSPSPAQRRSRSSAGGAHKSLERSYSEPPPLQRTPAPANPTLVRTPSTISQPWWRSNLARLHTDLSPSFTDGLGGSAWDVGRTPGGTAQRNPYRTPETPFSPGLRHFNSAGKGLGGPCHTFYEKTVIKPESCQPCGKRVRFGKTALRCRECRAVCHPQCRDQVPVPCVPSALTPTSRGHQAGQLADFTPLRGLMVPGLVQHCINEVEQRGMNEVGIYRVPGAERDVKELKARFLRGKGIPRLDQADIHVICGCIKDFLRMLQEPVVTHTLWQDFVRAATSDNTADLYQAISELPQPNRDTLAFVILHLQRVAEVPDNKMSVSSLAKVYGPTLVGYSSSDLEPGALLTETRQQQTVMEKLLGLSADYWTKIVETSSQEQYLYPGGDAQATPLRSGGVRTRTASRHGSYR